jgi:hypothetical protein
MRLILLILFLLLFSCSTEIIEVNCEPEIIIVERIIIERESDTVISAGFFKANPQSNIILAAPNFKIDKHRTDTIIALNFIIR